MLQRKSEEKENGVFEPPGSLNPLDVDERNKFMGRPEQSSAQTKQANAAPSPSAVIGPKIRFKGELFGAEDLLIQGQVEGTIELKDNNLIVGEQGVVKADVSAKAIVVQGKVEGDISAGERVSIKQSSNVQGNVKAARVVLEDGAKFRGSIDMDVSTSTEKSPSKKSEPVAPSTPGKETH